MPETDRLENSDEEAERRFEETVRRMVSAPPKPQEKMKLGKPRRKQVHNNSLGDAKHG